MLSCSSWTLPAPERHAAAASNRPGKWVSLLGWCMTAGAGFALLIGLTDVHNMAILLIAGAVFIPIGLLLITNGRILGKLANIEKNTRRTAEAAPAKRPDEF